MFESKVIRNTVHISKAEMELTRANGSEAFAKYCTDEYMAILRAGFEALMREMDQQCGNGPIHLVDQDSLPKY